MENISYKNLINGQWCDSSDKKTSTRKNPVTGKVAAIYPMSTPSDVQAAVSAARDAFDEGPWKRLSAIERSKVLLKVSSLIAENKEKLAQIETAEIGKPISIARGDMDACANMFEYAAGIGPALHGESYTNLGGDSVAFTVREPIGVVAMIIPWNFPSFIICQKLPFALASGCSVVIKPSLLTGGTIFEIARMCVEAGVPDGVINVVGGSGSTVGQQLVENKDVDRISFTGSTEVGESIIRGSASTFKRVSVELGGKGADIVFDDADLDDAVDGAMFGVFFDNGQVCNAGSRLLVQESIAEKFINRLVSETEKLKLGNPLDPETQLSTVIDENQMNCIVSYIESAKEEGARLRTGGSIESIEGCEFGYFIRPTIFDNVTPEMTIFKEEIFGPVLAVTTFETPAEALKLANQTNYGLANSLWTKDIDKALLFGQELQSGNVWINTITDVDYRLPYGGVKHSGAGREGGYAGIEEFTELKTIKIHRGKRSKYFIKD